MLTVYREDISATLEMTMRAKRYQNSAALLIFMRRTAPVEPIAPIEPAEPLSHAIKGQHSPWATLNLDPLSLLPISQI